MPSGVWAKHEYDKLPAYDGEPFEQMMKGGQAIFMCHQNDGKLCAGWVGTHGAKNLIALRLQANDVDPATWSYVSPVKLFASGKEARDHGIARIKNPPPETKAVVKRLLRKRPLKYNVKK